MKRHIALLFLAICAMPMLAQNVAPNGFASDFQTVPVMGNVPGAGATFQTYVAIMNPTAAAFPVVATLYDTAGTARTATINLAAGEMKTYSNFLDAVFNGYAGGGAVTFRTADPSRRFILDVEVWTSGARYGTSIPALEFAGSTSRSFAPGISVDGSARTNLGCFNQSGTAQTVAATVYSKTGTVVGTVNFDLAGNAWRQIGVSSTVTDGYVAFDPQEPAVCYAVVVTNSTNDGKFVEATEYEP